MNVKRSIFRLNKKFWTKEIYEKTQKNFNESIFS